MSAKREQNTLRFAVGTEGNLESSLWRLWTEGDEIYLLSRSSGNISKFSLHASGDYRLAINSDVKRNPVIKNRVLYGWRRPAEFSPGFTMCLGIIVPPLMTKKLFKSPPLPKRTTKYIKPPPKKIFPFFQKKKKVIFNLIITHKGVRPHHFFLKKERERFEIVGSVETKNEIVWITAFLDTIIEPSEDAVLQGYFDKLKLHLAPGSDIKSMNTTALQAIEKSKDDFPFVLDILLGEENVEMDGR